jgi:hypothetical protein
LKLAYIVSAYKNLGQLARLTRRLSPDGEPVAIHVDRKTDEREFAQLRSDVTELPGVHLLERHVCHWGGFGHVRATLKGIDWLLRNGVPFDYAILLTGQDYPIKPRGVIERFFAEHRGKSFMAYSQLPSPSWSPRGGLDRIEYAHWRLYGRHARLPLRRRFPAGLRPFGGGAYWCLTRECIELVSEFVAARPEAVRFFARADIPDELFFQTVIMNSRLADTVVNDNLRYIDWTRGVRPAILTTDDLPALKASPKLFARKFDVTRDERILDLIDRELLSGASGAKPPIRA